MPERNGAGQEVLVHQFVQNLQSLDTPVWRVRRDQLARLLGEVVEKHGIRSYVCWDDERLHDLGIPGILTALSLEDQEKEPEKADVGITMADLGIAETGSLVLFNGGKKRRTTSLLPPIYISFLHAANIVPRITQALAKVREIYRSSGDLPACINWITGPSRSGDIEMNLSLGVHGPGRVYVFLLDD